MRRNIGRLLGMLLTILIPVTSGLLLYDRASEHEYESFWDRTPGALMLYGRQPDERYRIAYERAAEAARAQGFRFPDLNLVQTNSLFDLWYVRWQQSRVIAVSMTGDSYLLIDGMWMTQFRDEDLECIMAHEIGHVVDVHMKRTGHPFFERTWCMDQQTLADNFGRYVCGPERYDPMFRRYNIMRPLVTDACPSRPPLP